MSFVHSLTSYLPGSLSAFLHSHTKHSQEYNEYGGGRHDRPCRACTDFQSWVADAKGSAKNSKESEVKKTMPVVADK